MNFKSRPPRLHRFLRGIVYPFALVWEWVIHALEGVERFIGRLGTQIGRIGRGVAQAVLPAGLFRGFEKGFIRIGRMAHAVGQYIVPWGLFTWIGRSMDRLWNGTWWVAASILGAMGAVLDRIVPPAFRRWLGRLWIPFWRAGAAVVDFINAWFRSRDYWRLLGALPALLLLLPLTICLAKSQFYSNRAKIHHYHQAAIAALEAKDYAKADLCYRKLAQLGQSERAEFEAALVKAAEGDLDAAYVSVGKLAPVEQGGYAPAHFWIAQQLVQGRLNVPPEQRWQLAEKHIHHVLKRNPRDLNAQWLEASLLMSAGRPDQAISKLEQLVHQLPALRLPLAELYMRQGRPDEAAAEARRLLRFYDKEGGAKQSLQPHEYLVWASTARALGQLELARQVIEKGLAIHPDDERFTALSTELYLASYDQATRSRSSLARRMELLGHALRLSPADEFVLKRIVQLATELGIADEEFQAMVGPVIEAGGRGTQGRGASDTSQVADGPSEEEATPRTTNFQLVNLIGVVAHEQQNHALAVEYFERQVKENPENAVAANNLAYELQFVGSTDLTRALRLADRAVQMELGNPAFHETRGQILVRLERWEEAVDDLEMAVNAMPGRADIHGALARAYAEMGKDDLAELHRRQAEGGR